ncbi:single-stranded DNA-binding protein [Campylobacter sp. JMF_04 NA10]|uniref:single-stranded DNA-binding protein n=1 Tax=Campylobacter sp. JMF_04 NA10 TaxID=2983824 RepID=UPI0022E9D6AC|nr:single-stranded DNA-binding protein [Campylobacter sp. JMF_04 NA10]MDA3076683.1 single-stranded DNA-binding protein [Campylobacter sp. JMF_04 NA10]
MFNKVVLVGNLTRDIELRYLQTGTAIGKTGIAVTRKFNSGNGEKREETCFIDIDFWGRTAEIANQYLRKGSKVLVEGRLKLDQWQDQNGQNRSKHSVVVESMEMLSAPQGGNGGNNSYGANSGGYGANSGNSYGGGYNQHSNYSNPNRQSSGGYGANQTAQNHYEAPKKESYESQIPEYDVDSDKYDEGNDTIPF